MPSTIGKKPHRDLIAGAGASFGGLLPFVVGDKYRQRRGGWRRPFAPFFGRIWDFAGQSAEYAKAADCAIARLPGKREGEDVVIRNSQYWVSPDVVVAVGKKSKVRAFGRIWDFAVNRRNIVDWCGD